MNPTPSTWHPRVAPVTIGTADGRLFDLANPEGNRVSIHEIAHALSNICRYTGHTREFYSVAQHSVLVSRLVPPQFAMQGLMHDAHEAFVGDMSGPLKQLVPGFKAIEDRIERMVRRRFNLPEVFDPLVKQADIRARVTEGRDLMTGWRRYVTQDLNIDPAPEVIEPMTPQEARELFLNRLFDIAEY